MEPPADEISMAMLDQSWAEMYDPAMAKSKRDAKEPDADDRKKPTKKVPSKKAGSRRGY